jgi:hypothetical protein
MEENCIKTIDSNIPYLAFCFALEQMAKEGWVPVGQHKNLIFFQRVRELYPEGVFKESWKISLSS